MKFFLAWLHTDLRIHREYYTSVYVCVCARVLCASLCKISFFSLCFVVSLVDHRNYDEKYTKKRRTENFAKAIITIFFTDVFRSTVGAWLMNHIQRRTVHSAHRFERLPLFGSPSAMSYVCVLERMYATAYIRVCLSLCVFVLNTLTHARLIVQRERARESLCWVHNLKKQTATFNTYSDLYTKLQKIVRTQTQPHSTTYIQSIACKKSWKRFWISSTTVTENLLPSPPSLLLLLVLPFSIHTHQRSIVNSFFTKIGIWCISLLFDRFTPPHRTSYFCTLHSKQSVCALVYARCINSCPFHFLLICFCWCFFFAFSLHFAECRTTN